MMKAAGRPGRLPSPENRRFRSMTVCGKSPLPEAMFPCSLRLHQRLGMPGTLVVCGEGICSRQWITFALLGFLGTTAIGWGSGDFGAAGSVIFSGLVGLVAFPARPISPPK